MRIIPMPCGFRRDGVQCSKDAGHRDDHLLDEEFVLTEEGLAPTGRTGREIIEAVQVDRALARVAERLRDTEPAAAHDADRIETHARCQTVISLLERCAEELARLELVPSSDADDVNALSGARGFVSRARNILRGRFA